MTFLGGGRACMYVLSVVLLLRRCIDLIFCSGFKFSQCEMSMCLRPLRTCLCELTKTAEVVLSILLEAFAFRLPDVEIGWNTASVHYPSVKNNAKARLPMKVKKL